MSQTGVKGSYGYRKPTGEFRVVDYLADEYGFNARVKQSPEASTTSTTGELKDHSPSYETVTSTSVSSSSRSSPILIKSRAERKNNDLNNEQVRQERLEQLNEQQLEQQVEQKSDKVVREAPEVVTTPIPSPKVLMSGREVEGRDQSVFVKPMKPQTRKSIANKISIHQLVSEAMPSLQMSVVPVYFVNKVTKNVMAIPYLVMKSVSKMPLLPGMFDGINGISQNLLNFQHTPTPHRVQRSNWRSGTNLASVLAQQDRQSAQLQSSIQQRVGQQKETENDLDDVEEREQNNEWMPVNDQQFTEQQNSWWRK